jgi:hypothetical protein
MSDDVEQVHIIARTFTVGKDHSMTPIVISSIGGQCPCQAEGTFYGNPFYFRARCGDWTIEVAHPGDDPVCNPSLFYMEGPDPEDGFMEVPESMKHIGKAFGAFTDKYAAQIYRGEAWPLRITGDT